jgi:hypothetical protein
LRPNQFWWGLTWQLKRFQQPKTNTATTTLQKAKSSDIYSSFCVNTTSSSSLLTKLTMVRTSA